MLATTAEVVVLIPASAIVDEELVGSATAGEDEEATTAATVEAEVPEVPKLLEAVVEAPLLTSTLLMITTSPLSAVTLTSTVVVPKPEDCSKKL